MSTPETTSFNTNAVARGCAKTRWGSERGGPSCGLQREHALEATLTPVNGLCPGRPASVHGGGPI